MSKYNTNKNKYLAKSERASVPKITKKQKGSITIEAAFAIPLFLFRSTLSYMDDRNTEH